MIVERVLKREAPARYLAVAVWVRFGQSQEARLLCGACVGPPLHEMKNNTPHRLEPILGKRRSG